MTNTDGGEPEAVSDDMLHAVLAFYRLSRSLRNADLIRDLDDRFSLFDLVHLVINRDLRHNPLE